MKKGLIAAAALVLVAAAAAGCALKGAFPAFLMPEGPFLPSETESPAAAETTPAASAKPTPAATTVPTATPKPAPKPAPKPYDIVARYNTQIPVDLTVSLAYDRYAMQPDYFVALRSGRIYAEATLGSKALRSFAAGARFQVTYTVLGEDGKSRWHRVLWAEKGAQREGYVKESTGPVRSFRLGMMLERAEALKGTTDSGATVYITNYKNGHGLPPALPGGKEEDAWGYRRSQSAPAYASPDAKSAMRYAPDGLLGRKLEASGGYTKIFFPSFGEARWVPDRYVSRQADAIPSLTQVVVVDRKCQNAAVFEYGANGWTLLARTMVSTGKTGGYSLRTPLGDFMAQERAAKFYYYADGTKFIEGYAPWAVRFSGGGYLHGVPRKCDYDVYGNRWDPEPSETLRTLGTTPQSHMCVRNYTSFAKFVYDWFKKGQCAVIVVE